MRCAGSAKRRILCAGICRNGRSKRSRQRYIAADGRHEPHGVFLDAVAAVFSGTGSRHAKQENGSEKTVKEQAIKWSVNGKEGDTPSFFMQKMPGRTTKR